MRTIDQATGEPIATHGETTASELDALLDRARERARAWAQALGELDESLS